MSQLSDFLSTHGLAAEALVRASSRLEARSVNDRELAVKRETARRKKAQEPYDKLGLEKPAALGRGVSVGLVQRAIAGQPVSRMVRKKILRAVNEELKSLKKDNATVRQIFGDVKSHRRASAKKKK